MNIYLIGNNELLEYINNIIEDKMIHNDRYIIVSPEMILWKK